MSDSNEVSSADNTNASDDTLERLRNITKLFGGKIDEEDENQELQNVEKFAPSEKIKNVFQKFEEIGLSNGKYEYDNGDGNVSSNGTLGLTRKWSTTKEHVPYHEMAEVKDKFEKGLLETNKPRVEKRLDARVQSGSASAKKQAFELGEFERETESNKNKTPIEIDLVAGLTSSKKQVFEQQQINNEANIPRTTLIEHDVLVGLATETKAKFENGQISDISKTIKYPDEIATIVGTGIAQAKLSEFLSKIDPEQQNQRSSTRPTDIETEQGLAIARRQQFASLMNNEYRSTEKDIDVIAGLTTETKAKFENGQISDIPKTIKYPDEIATIVGTGIAQAKLWEFLSKVDPEQQNQRSSTRPTDIETEQGLATARRQQFASLMNNEYRSTEKDIDVIAGLTTETKAKFENGQISDSSRALKYPDEIATIAGTGIAQAKLSEFLSKIDPEQQNQRSNTQPTDIDTEQGLAIARRQQFASLMNNEYKPTEKNIDVTAGLASLIKEQYIADASKGTMSTSKAAIPSDDIESGLAKNRALVFQKLDEPTVTRTVDIGSEVVERGVTKERAIMFKNWENGATSSARPSISGETKIRVDGFRWHVSTCEPLNGSNLRRKHQSIENGVVVRESDKNEEIYFEKGQTKQLVEQWKTKQLSPDREISELQSKNDAEAVQQGKAKNLVQMWKTMDKENTPPPERRGTRPITPPPDYERSKQVPDDEKVPSEKSNYVDDTVNIESGYAKSIRERFLQNAQEHNSIEKRKALKQFTPPPDASDGNRRKSITPPKDGVSLNEPYSYQEEIMAIKGQAQSLKNRFIELEQDARKIETAASKMKYVPNRFVKTPAPKQAKSESNGDSTKCFECNKIVYAMERIEADKKVYHKSCFK